MFNGLYRHTLKRGLDIIICILSAVFIIPLICIVALLIYLNIGTPIFFRQQRPGKLGEPFYIYKFRTMSNAVDSDGNLLPDHQRLSRFGKMLRSSSLDEFPALYNVLKGDMSLVGPRPLLMQYLELYTPEQMRRHEVRPGITGWAQINGRNSISWEEKFSHDVWYVENLTFWVDFKIILTTVLKVFQRNGISEMGEATMSLYKGYSESETRSLATLNSPND